MHSIQRVFEKWKGFPGNWDSLHVYELFDTDNEYGIPLLEKCSHRPTQLIQWGSKPNLLVVEKDSNTAIHFFIDDYRFECIWKHPARYIELIQHVGSALTPDFSLFRDMPLAMQIWNTYRSRWLGCYWQSYGISVIPTISWSQPYDLCYYGIPQGSIVAISSVGLNDQQARYLFREGFEKMIAVIKPETILCYGKMPKDIKTDIPIVNYPTRWELQKSKRALHPSLSLWET